MKVDQELIDEAVQLLKQRYPNSGGLAAAAYDSEGTIYSSVVFEPEWGAGGLCAETGALLEIHKAKKQLAAIVCVSRLDNVAPIYIVAPCGICQERIAHWGYAVSIGVPKSEDPTTWEAKTLNDIQPFHWSKIYLNTDKK